MASEKTGLKSWLKKRLSKKTLDKVLPAFHYGQAAYANARAGFPARGMQVIGVTGTNGKTTTVAFIENILREAGYKVATYSTTHYRISDDFEKNKTTTTMESVYHLQQFYREARKAKVDFVVQEVTSQALAQHRVYGITFKAAVMTNLTYEHQDYHKGMRDYAEAKALLFKNEPEFIVLNADDIWYTFYNKNQASKQKLSYGSSEEAGARIKNPRYTIRESSFILDLGKAKLDLRTHLVGSYNSHNIAAAATTCHLLGIEQAAIEKGVKSLKRVDGRLEYIDNGQDFAVFTDYAHTPDGLENVLTSLKQVTKGRLLLVQSSMDGRDPAKRVLLGEASGLLCDEIFVTDEEAFKLPTEQMRNDIIQGTQNVRTKARVHEIPDRQKAINAAVAAAKKDDTVLIVPFGHQTSMEFYGKTYHWDERDAAMKALKLRESMTKKPSAQKKKPRKSKRTRQKA